MRNFLKNLKRNYWDYDPVLRPLMVIFLLEIGCVIAAVVAVILKLCWWIL